MTGDDAARLAVVLERARALGVDVDDPANAEVLAAVARIPETSAEANTRLQAMAAEVERVNRLAADPAARRRATVWCARCGAPDSRRKPPGVVLDTSDGLLLAVDQQTSYVLPTPDDLDLVPATPAEVRAAGRDPKPSRGGWLLDGPHTWARMFGPQGYPRTAAGAMHPDGHIPAVTCRVHGRLRPDPETLAAGVTSGWRAAGVAEDGTVSKIGGGR